MGITANQLCIWIARRSCKCKLFLGNLLLIRQNTKEISFIFFKKMLITFTSCKYNITID